MCYSYFNNPLLNMCVYIFIFSVLIKPLNIQKVLLFLILYTIFKKSNYRYNIDRDRKKTIYI